MILEIRNYFLLFIIYSIAGWLLEVVFTLFTDKKLTNRGFYIGPICPIYGVGCISIILLLTPYKEHPIGLFILAIVLCSVLEYLTSYLMEKLFKARWWDYSNRKFNINGRICLETMIPFGIVACLVIYIINPFIIDNLKNISNITLNVVALVLLIIFTIDTILSFNIVNNFKKTVKKVSMEDRTEDVNAYIKNLLLEKSILYKRLVQAFPKIEAKIKDLKEKVKKD